VLPWLHDYALVLVEPEGIEPSSEQAAALVIAAAWCESNTLPVNTQPRRVAGLRDPLPTS